MVVNFGAFTRRSIRHSLHTQIRLTRYFLHNIQRRQRMSQMVQRRFNRRHTTFRTARALNNNMIRIRRIAPSYIPRQQITIFVTMAGSFNGSQVNGALQITNSRRRTPAQIRFQPQQTSRFQRRMRTNRRTITNRIITLQRRISLIISLRFTKNIGRNFITRTMRQLKVANQNSSNQTTSRFTNNKIFRSRRVTLFAIRASFDKGQHFTHNSLITRTFGIVQRKDSAGQTIHDRALCLTRVDRLHKTRRRRNIAPFSGAL